MPRGKVESLEEWREKRNQHFAAAEEASNAKRAERIKEIETASNASGGVEHVSEREYEPESWADYQERTVDRKKLRSVGKQARKDFTSAIQDAGGDDKAQSISTNKVYKGMGGRPSGSDRGSWSIEEQQRCAVTENWAASIMRFVFGEEKQPKPESQNDQTQINAQIIDTVADAATDANDFMNDPNGMGGVSGLFGFFFGDEAQKDNVEPRPEPQPQTKEEAIAPASENAGEEERHIIDKTLDFLYKIL